MSLYRIAGKVLNSGSSFLSTMKARTFELPIDGLFHISGVNSILQSVKRAFPDMQILQQPHRRSLFLISGKKRSVTELLEAVGDIMDLVLTEVQQKKQCPACGVGAIYGWTRFCRDCKRNQEEWATLLLPDPIIDEELDELELDTEYDLLLAELDRLEEAANLPIQSIFELPYGESQGAFSVKQLFDIMRIARDVYDADLQIGDETVTITIDQPGISETELLSPLSAMVNYDA